MITTGRISCPQAAWRQAALDVISDPRVVRTFHNVAEFVEADVPCHGFGGPVVIVFDPSITPVMCPTWKQAPRAPAALNRMKEVGYMVTSNH